jgi:alpha-1,2-mannosyltransferase
MLFIYPPFAAVCAVPLALLGSVTVQVLWLLGMVAALTFVVVRMLTTLGMRASGGLVSLVALLVGVLAWLEPMRLTAELGQINLVLLVLVVTDLLGGRSKWSGVGIGLAAGLKLTPALFIVYLIAIRRTRAAVVAAATFAGTIALGFAVAPRDSVSYWLHGRFDDVNRISHDPLANTSIAGLVSRLHGSPSLGTVVAAAVAVCAVAIAAAAYRRDQPVLALAIVGLASAAASPFSWSHHWVWFAPLVVHLGYRGFVAGSRMSVAAVWLLCALIGGWIFTTAGGSPQAGILSLRPPGIWGQLWPAAYVFVFAAVLLGTAVWLVRPRSAGLTRHDLEYIERVDAGHH